MNTQIKQIVDNEIKWATDLVNDICVVTNDKGRKNTWTVVWNCEAIKIGGGETNLFWSIQSGSSVFYCECPHSICPIHRSCLLR